jgi:hypothetical protein
MGTIEYGVWQTAGFEGIFNFKFGFYKWDMRILRGNTQTTD